MIKNVLYSFVLKKFPEDGNSVTKHVGILIFVMSCILLSASVVKLHVCALCEGHEIVKICPIFISQGFLGQ